MNSYRAYLACIALLALLLPSEGNTQEVRPPAVAGTFYPADPDSLAGSSGGSPGTRTRQL